ncbi:hypothetical protein TNCV_677521 [Trichonephila clavipes]|nr:hypothetical protein TNCV_677521 [Trichonephila clavipes]
MNAARYIEILNRFMKAYAGYDPSTRNKVHDFLFTAIPDLTQPISSNTSWPKRKEVVKIERPPYSPDLNPPDFFLF